MNAGVIASSQPFAEGGCACGEIRYRLHARPIVVHCCHCHRCQRETGSAFALNALLEAANFELVQGIAEKLTRPTESGLGQDVHFCPSCRTAVWSVYSGAGPGAVFIRAGTLDNPYLCPPGVHIYTESKQEWVILPDGVPAFEGYYGGKDLPGLYGEDGAARWRAVRGR